MFTYLGNFQAQALLRAVKKENHGTVLFAPRLTMFNNQRAHVFVGRETAYISNWSSSGGVYTPQVSTAVMDGVSLDVRPVVSHDRRYITLELRPSLVRPVGARRFSINSSVGGDDDDDGDGLQNGADPTPLGPIGGDIDGDGILNQNDTDVDGDGQNNGSTAGNALEFSLPELEVRAIRTVVTVPDGGNVLLSGLMTETTSDQRSGIPFLMNLPILGRLFSTDFKDVERRNLLILVTANLILFAEEEAKL
jgi:general secretion pathway protein D